MTDDKLGKSRTPQESEQNIQLHNQAGEIVKTAMEGMMSAESHEPQEQQGPRKLGGIGDQFKGLPMRELIAAPLIAVAEAQQELATTAWDFYKKVAFLGKDEKGPNGEGEGATRILDFKVKRPIEQQGKMTMVDQEIQAPFIGLVPIPSLLVDRVDVDFQMEVSATETSKSNFSSDVSTNISSGWFVKAEVSGKVSTSRENTRVSNQTGKYQIHVSASQQPQTEGLSKLMDIMASCIEPVPAQQKQQ